MSIATREPQTADQIHQQEVLARRRAMINQKAASIQVTVQRNGKPTSVFLNTLPPVERAKAIQQLLNVPEEAPTTHANSGAVIPPAPATPTPAPAPAEIPADTTSSGKAPSRFKKRAPAASATKKARKKAQ